jgi:hypothetical protein
LEAVVKMAGLTVSTVTAPLPISAPLLSTLIVAAPGPIEPGMVRLICEGDT